MDDETVVMNDLSLDRAAEAAGEAAVSMRRVASAVDLLVIGWRPPTGDWSGEAAAAFHRLGQEVRDAFGVAVEGFSVVSAAAGRLATRLSEAARSARAASDRLESANAATRTWRRSWDAWRASENVVDRPPPPPIDDPGHMDRLAAGMQLEAVERDVAGAVAEFATRLDAVAAVAPRSAGPRRNAAELLGEFGSGIADSIRETLDTVWRFGTPRMLFDSAGWRSEVGDTVDSMVRAADDPFGAVSAMLDLDTWLESPARAAGRLVPDVLAGAAAGGAAAGTRRAADAFDGLADAGRAGSRSGIRPRPDDPSSPVINLTAVGDRMGDHAARIGPVDGYTDVAIHGSDSSFGTTPGGPPVSPREVATWIEANPKYDGGPLRLISCRSGSSSCGPASTLAGELGAEVLAPSTTVWVYPDGKLVLGEGVFSGAALTITEPGEWIRFLPGEVG